MAKDFYSILGVSRDASEGDIKKAYRKLSKELHPDKHKGDKEKEAKFKEVNEAYETLGNKQKRAQYDQFGSAGNPFGGGGGGYQQYQGNYENVDFSQFGGGFGDIFEQFFGGGGRRRGGGQANNRGNDIEIALTIDFADAVKGMKREVTFETLVTCDKCDGKGAEKGSDMIDCETCGGSGQVMRTAQSFFGTIQQAVICGTCQGSGKVPSVRCSKCEGEGRVRAEKTVKIDIPAGIDNGQRLRIRGEGEAGRQGGDAGDLYATISVREDKRFERHRDDIHTTLSAAFTDAALGITEQVETVHGKVKLKIPAGTQPGDILRIKGKGMPQIGSSRIGDHYVTIEIEVPKKLSRSQKKMLEELKGEGL